jgi:hypothetical protein
MLDWCARGQHDICRRSVQRFLVDPKSNAVVWLEDWLTCNCRKRGCKCYTKPADRPKTKKRRRKA